MAEEIDSLLETTVALANTKNLGRFVFGGNNSYETPYVIEREDGRISSVSYQGGTSELRTPVSPDVTFSGLLIGDQLMRSNNRSAPQFFGSTGLAAGIATSSVRGDHWLAVTHNQTVLTDPDATGLTAGTDSDSSDTFIGDGIVTLNADARTVRLDAGTAVSYTGSEENLKLTNENGDSIHVNLSTLAAGVSGTHIVNLVSSGRISLDEQEAVDIEGTANQPITDADGKILYIDSTKLQRTGNEPVTVAGTYDLFGAIINARDLLLNKRDLPERQQLDLIDKAVGNVNEVSEVVRRSITAIGSRLSAMDSMTTSLENAQSAAQTQQSTLQDADIIQIATRLSHIQTLYQMTLTTTAKLLSLSLLDFMT
jgi:flagellin-like hook-associated protein FlgL